MFRTSKCPSSGAQVVCFCMWWSALGVVAVVLRSRCVVLCTVCKFVHNMYSWRWAYRCPKHVEIFMIIIHNCCIKLVPLVIFIYDARSHIHQTVFYVYLLVYATYVSIFWPLMPEDGQRMTGKCGMLLNRYKKNCCVWRKFIICCHG